MWPNNVSLHNEYETNVNMTLNDLFSFLLFSNLKPLEDSLIKCVNVCITSYIYIKYIREGKRFAR